MLIIGIPPSQFVQIMWLFDRFREVWNWVCTTVSEWLNLKEGLLDNEERNEESVNIPSVTEEDKKSIFGKDTKSEKDTTLEMFLKKEPCEVDRHWKNLDFFSDCESYGDSNCGMKHGMTIMYSSPTIYRGYVTYEKGVLNGPFMALMTLFPLRPYRVDVVVVGKYKNDKITQFKASNEEICLYYEGYSSYHIIFPNGHRYPVAKVENDRLDLQSSAIVS